MIVTISADPVARVELSMFVSQRRADIVELKSLLDARSQQQACDLAEHIAEMGKLFKLVFLELVAQRLHNALRLDYNKVIEPAIKEMSSYLDSLEDELAQKCA
jgi:HPt (histidine-containing phosphotransfer) domain-containing protein